MNRKKGAEAIDRGERSIKNICEQAVIEGRKINLEGCCYGPAHWQGPVLTEASDYYYFLAGFVRSQGLTSILELGTHFGGSIMAMSRGINSFEPSQSCLVTADVTFLNEEGFKKYPQIKRIKGDILSGAVIRQIEASFVKSVDLIYIDTDHKYAHVKTAISVYANRLRPKFIILDDILLNDSMKRLLKEIKSEFKERAFNAGDLGVRSDRVGFGVIAWGGAYSLRWGLIEVLYRPAFAIFLFVKKLFKRITDLKSCG